MSSVGEVLSGPAGSSAGGVRNRLDADLSWLGKWILAGAFFAMPLNALRPVSSLSYGDVVLLLALGIAVALVAIRMELPTLPRWLWLGAGLILLSALILEVLPAVNVDRLEASFPDTLNQSSLTESLKLLVGAAVLPVVAATIIREWKEIGILAGAWVAGVSLSCAFAVSDAYIGTDLQLAFTYDIDSVIGFFVIEPARSIGLTVHSNALSLTTVMATPMVLFRMTSFRRIALYYPVFLLFLLGVLLSGARAGLIGVILAGILTLVLSKEVRDAIRSNSVRVAAVTVIGLAVCAAVIFGLSVKPSSRAADYFRDRAVSGQAARLESRLLVSSKVEAPQIVMAAEAPPEEDASGSPSAIDRFGGDSSTAVSDLRRRQYLEDSIKYIVERPVPGYGYRWIEASHNIFCAAPALGRCPGPGRVPADRPRLPADWIQTLGPGARRDGQYGQGGNRVAVSASDHGNDRKRDR